MLIKSTKDFTCEKCGKKFRPLVIQSASYHCEDCGKHYTLCPDCATNANCRCTTQLNDAWHVDGRLLMY